MKRKLLLVLAVIFALAVTLTACEHVHTFADEWTHDTEYHWHEATCGDTDEVFGKEKHTMQAVTGGEREECTVCGYSKKIQTENPNPNPNPNPNQPEKHEHNYVDGVCDGCGQWSSVTDVILAQCTKLDVWNYVVTVKDVEISHPTLLNGDNVTVKYAELQLQLTSKGQIEGCGYIQLKYVPTDDETVDAVATVVLKDDIAYVGANDGEQIYARMTVEELLAKLKITVDKDAFKKAVDELNANTSQVQAYVEELTEAVKQLPVGDEFVKGIIDTFLTLNAEKSNNNTTVYALKYDAFRTANVSLKTITVSQYFEAAFGKDSYAQIPATVEAMFDVKIGDILDILAEQGYTIDNIIAMLNAAIANYYPDEKVNTVEQLMESAGMNLNGVSAKEYILLLKPLTPRQMLKLAQVDVLPEQQITVNQIVAKLTALCDSLQDATLYDVLLQAAKLDKFTSDELAQIVDGVIGILEEGMTVEFRFENNALQQLTIDFNVNAPLQALDDDASVVESAIWQIRQQLSFFNVDSIGLTLGGNMQQDYSAFIAEVIANTTAQAA